ncbi:heme-binding domain-containing protein [Terrimonas pollutisoli]|uniref:heme-binding domain-containing protein n=1 Tax=Terrimonas pollutisoli TaxID=3034147 RepID=UPI0023EAA2AE|nr:heme-binding domain-containing protein [Terrimonas sp. H1YJ31]
MLKKIFLFLLVILVIIQFIHPEKNKATGPQANYIGNVHPVPDDIKIILAKACNDCHSNNTEYPWYSAIQPVDWWMSGHVKNGKKHLNLDDYSNRSLRYQYHKLEEIEEQIKEGEMPLQSYTWVHKDAILTAAEKEKIISWTNTLRDSMKAKYPIDSLIRKK